MVDMIAEVMIMDLEDTTTATAMDTIMVTATLKNPKLDMKVITMELEAAADTTTEHLATLTITIKIMITPQSKQKVKPNKISLFPRKIILKSNRTLLFLKLHMLKTHWNHIIMELMIMEHIITELMITVTTMTTLTSKKIIHQIN
jgi:hypothetical protein